MEVVTGALSSLLPKLADLLVGEYNLHKGVKGEIMFLQAELESMKVALEELSDAPANRIDKLDKIWARDVRELSYDIEDSTDTFMVHGSTGGEPPQPHGFNKFIDRSLGLLTRVRIRHKIATDIRDIRRRVMEVSERRQRYKISSVAAQHVWKTSEDPRLFVQYTKATELVGIDEARDEVTKILMGRDGESEMAKQQQKKIVSIVGFGGLGKTSLAKAVYEKLRAQFDCSAFVSVSQSPDKDKIFQDMFYQLANKNSAKINVRDEISELLQSKRYSVHTYYRYAYLIHVYT
jgi:uridine kinase